MLFAAVMASMAARSRQQELGTDALGNCIIRTPLPVVIVVAIVAVGCDCRS